MSALVFIAGLFADRFTKSDIHFLIIKKEAKIKAIEKSGRVVIPTPTASTAKSHQSI
jgi:hypothetical protein